MRAAARGPLSAAVRDARSPRRRDHSADDRSPAEAGARRDYIDLLLSEVDRELTLAWIGAWRRSTPTRCHGSGAVFRQARRRAGRCDSSGHQPHERAPQTPLETFFVMAKQATIPRYYTSNIGIHEEPAVQGQPIPPGVRGFARPRRKRLPHCGQKTSLRVSDGAG